MHDVAHMLRLLERMVMCLNAASPEEDVACLLMPGASLILIHHALRCNLLVSMFCGQNGVTRKV